MQSAGLPSVIFLATYLIQGYIILWCLSSPLDLSFNVCFVISFFLVIIKAIAFGGILIASIRQFKKGVLIKAYINLSVFLLLILMAMFLYSSFLWPFMGEGLLFFKDGAV